jgi:hypothetical protein
MSVRECREASERDRGGAPVDMAERWSLNRTSYGLPSILGSVDSSHASYFRSRSVEEAVDVADSSIRLQTRYGWSMADIVIC